MVLFKCKIINIHPKWFTEEKAKIFFNDVWFNPPIAPTIEEMAAEIII